MENKILTTTFQLKDKKLEQIDNRIVISNECCLTCGGNKRLQWLEKIDGRKVVKEVCLFCSTRTHTARNREDH